MIVVGIILLFFVGLSVLNAISDKFQLLEKIGLSLLIGMAFYSFVMLPLDLLGIKITQGSLAVSGILAIIACNSKHYKLIFSGLKFDIAEIKKYENQFGANDSTYWLVFELLWRDFFRFMFKKYQTKFFLYEEIKTEKANSKSLNEKLLSQWINGATPSDFINANMLELQQTGFMSNRGRQNVASYFCNELNMDWRIGAAYFEEQLIDYDVCSNWGNWAYLAGVGNDPRGHRYFNIEKQAADYDKKKLFRNLWLKS